MLSRPLLESLEVDPDSRLRARYGGDAVIVFRGVLGTVWGWFTREDPRMHLQTVNESGARAYKVWLERDGMRVFEPAGRMPAKLRLALEKRVAAERSAVEAKWTNFMIEKGWLHARLDGSVVHLVAYPGTGGELRRSVDLLQELPGLADRRLERDDVRLDPEFASLMVLARRGDDAYRVFLPDVLWQGRR